ncbi:hypothetical protein Tco_1419592 [Tanacetum coccineum]
MSILICLLSYISIAISFIWYRRALQCPIVAKFCKFIKNHPITDSAFALLHPSGIYWHGSGHTLKEADKVSALVYAGTRKKTTLHGYFRDKFFHLPQATVNNHNSFVPPPSFSDMVLFYKKVLGFTMELKTQSNFKTTGLLQPWQTLCKIFSKCLTTRVTGWDQPPLQIMQMLRSARLTPPAPVPNVDKADEMILQDTLQVSLVEHKSREEQEARENVALVDEHLASKEIDKMVEGQENVVDDSSIPKNDESNIPGTRIEPRSNKESPEVESTKDKEVEITKETPVVEITNVVIPMNVNDDDEEITDEVYELKRREKGKLVEETRNSPIPTPIRSPRIHTNLVSSNTEKLQELTDSPHTTSSSSSPHKKLAKTNRLLSLFKTKPTRFKCYKSFFHELQGRYGYLFAHLWARFMPEQSFDTLADNFLNSSETWKNIQAQISTQIENAIANVIPSQVDASVRSYMSGHILHVHPAQSKTSSVPDQQYQLYLAMKADPQLQQQDIAIWLALQMMFERNTNSAKRQKTSSDEALYLTDSYASDDDEIPMKQVSQDIMEEVSLTNDEAKLRKMDDEM